MAKLDENGHEILDDTPVSIPVKFLRAETLTDQVRAVIRNEASRAASVAGYETFEEADDFFIEDEYDPRSPHEMTIDQELEGYGEATRDDRSLEREAVDARARDSKKGGSVEGGGEDDKGDDAEPPSDKRSIGGEGNGGKGGAKKVK